MSFLTAISLSVSNLMTKRVVPLLRRLQDQSVLLVLLRLSLASGINLYIDTIEQETMSAYPLSIDSRALISQVLWLW